jgi:hypothetical protein
LLLAYFVVATADNFILPVSPVHNLVSAAHHCFEMAEQTIHRRSVNTDVAD